MFSSFCKVAPDTITLWKFTEMLKAELCPSKNSHFEDFGSEAPGYGCIWDEVIKRVRSLGWTLIQYDCGPSQKRRWWPRHEQQETDVQKEGKDRYDKVRQRSGTNSPLMVL